MTSQTDKPSLFKSHLYVITAYLAAAAGAIALLVFFKDLHPIAAIAIADVGATIIVFFFSVLFNNSSFYDPYWSVAPVPIAAYWIIHPASMGADEARQWVAFALILFWALRLTWNWASGWQGLSHEDWRYVDFRERGGKNYWAISFSGIHMFPTLLVFAASLSMYPALSAGTNPFNWLDIAATVITFIAVLMELTADIQLKMFKKFNTDPSQFIDVGLWKYSRHPNYFGEVLFWWGLFIFALAADPSYWWTALGPLAITLLFYFISIPMMDKRMVKNRPAYAEHMKKVSSLVPWFRKA